MSGRVEFTFDELFNAVVRGVQPVCLELTIMKERDVEVISVDEVKLSANGQGLKFWFKNSMGYNCFRIYRRGAMERGEVRVHKDLDGDYQPPRKTENQYVR